MLTFSFVSSAGDEQSVKKLDTAFFQLPDFLPETLHRYVLGLPDMQVNYHMDLVDSRLSKEGVYPTNSYELTKKGNAYKLLIYSHKDDKVPFLIFSWDGNNFYSYSPKDKGLRIGSKLNIDLGAALESGMGSFPPICLSGVRLGYGDDIRMISKNNYKANSEKSKSKLNLTISDDRYLLGDFIVPKSVEYNYTIKSNDSNHPGNYIMKVTKCNLLDGKFDISKDFFKIPLSQCLRVIDHDLDELQIELDNE